MDLSLIIKDLNLYSGNSDSGCLHPVVQALTELSDTLSTEGATDKDEYVKQRLEVIRTECDADLAHRFLASKHSAFSTLMTACEKFTSRPETHLLCLKTMASLINGQPDLVTGQAIIYFVNLLKVTDSDERVINQTLKIIHYSCVMHESNRQTFVAEDLIGRLVHVMDRYKDNRHIVGQSCICLRTLTLDDDVRVPFGKAHEHAKMIVTEANALKAIMKVCKGNVFYYTCVYIMAKCIVSFRK